MCFIGTGDLFNIESEVLYISPQWKKFGGALNIDEKILRKIAAEKNEKTEECLHETLHEFLKMNYDTKAHGRPSWRLIVQALAHRNGGNDKELALEIAGNHPTTKSEANFIKLCDFGSHKGSIYVIENLATNGAPGSGPTGGGAKTENTGNAENTGKAENKAILSEFDLN